MKKKLFNSNNIYNEDPIIINLIAKTQEGIYNLAYDMGYDIEAFSNFYLQSDFCKYEMDALYSKFQTEFPEACMDEIQEELENKNIVLPKRTEECFYSPGWVGKMYRYLFFELQMPSNELASEMPFQKIAEKDSELENDNLEDQIKELVTINIGNEVHDDR